MVIKTNRQCNFFPIVKFNNCIAVHINFDAMYNFMTENVKKIFLLEIRNIRQNKLELSRDRNAVISASL